MNNQTTIRAGQTLSPSTEQDLKDFLRLDDGDCENLQIYLDSATSAVISYLSCALLDQEFTYVIDGYPYQGTVTQGLAPNDVRFKTWIELPYSYLTAITSVSLIDQDGEETIIDPENYQLDNYSIPNRLKFTNAMSTTDRIKIVYTTGYGTDSEEIPNSIRLGILQVAGYLYEHRGECTPAQAVTESGAGLALQPFRVITKI